MTQSLNSVQIMAIISAILVLAGCLIYIKANLNKPK